MNQESLIIRVDHLPSGSTVAIKQITARYQEAEAGNYAVRRTLMKRLRKTFKLEAIPEWSDFEFSVLPGNDLVRPNN